MWRPGRGGCGLERPHEIDVAGLVQNDAKQPQAHRAKEEERPQPVQGVKRIGEVGADPGFDALLFYESPQLEDLAKNVVARPGQQHQLEDRLDPPLRRCMGGERVSSRLSIHVPVRGLRKRMRYVPLHVLLYVHGFDVKPFRPLSGWRDFEDQSEEAEAWQGVVVDLGGCKWRVFR